MSLRCLALLLLSLLGLPSVALAVDDMPVTAVPLAPDEHIVLDGRLDHPAWRRAPAHAAFHTKGPVYGAPPVQATRVQVLYDAQALYVGVTALDDGPAHMRAPLVRTDQVNRTQDFVVVYIDAIGSRRAAQFFRVNAAGSLADGLHTAADDSEDFAPDFDWDGAVARDAGGWTAVLRIPFASLRFAGGADGRWRIMVGRRVPREQFHLLTSVPVPNDVPSFISTMQPLEGVQLPPSRHFVTVRPSVTVRHDGEDGTEVDASLDVKWRPRPELVVDATLNPDFSQVALDVPQLSGNERFALLLTEKRPFFFESADLLRSPTDALYTRSLTAPRWGLRGTWRGSNVAGTVFAIADRGGGAVLLPGPYDTGVAAQPASTALAGRGRWDAGPVQWGLLGALRHYEHGLGDNQVIGPDLGWQVNDAWRVRAQWLHARTTARPGLDGLEAGPAASGNRVYVRAFYNRGNDEFNLSLDDIGEDFRHDTGFVAQSGIRKVKAWLAHGWRGLSWANEFWVNSEAWLTHDRANGDVVEAKWRPGIYLTGSRNLEAWVEWHALSRLRVRPGGTLHDERFVDAGLIFTPAPWFSFLEAHLTAGRMVDTAGGVDGITGAADGRVRDGRRAYLRAHVRPLAALEVEPQFWWSALDGEGEPRFRETAAQLLAVWHLDAKRHLRLIAQRSTLDRGAGVSFTNRAVSLTYAWRHSAGTVLYVGASRGDDGPSVAREAFVKLQFDADVLRGWF